MRLANIKGRAALITPEGAIDIATATRGAVSPQLPKIFNSWDHALPIIAAIDPALAEPFELEDLQSPSPAPRQVFGIGLNYHAHAAETGRSAPEFPATFTKFPSSLSGPASDITIVNDTVDWEVELVVIIGRTARQVSFTGAWSYVAGLTLGQDISDRTLQQAAGGQFSLGKSHEGFGPMGPWLVTPDEFDDPNDIEIACAVNGEEVQTGRSSDLIFSVPRLIEELSAVVTLYPGDVIFTGTPSGVGVARQPARFLAPGDVLESWGAGIGSMRNLCVAPQA